MALAFTLLVSSCGDSGSGNAPVGGVVGEAERCFVTVRFTGDGELTNGDVFLEYTGVEGGFGAPGPTTRCRALPAQMQGVFLTNYCDEDCEQERWEKRSLHLAFFVAGDGAQPVLAGPTDLFRCDFEGDASTLTRIGLDGYLTGPERDWNYGQGLEVRTECGRSESTTTTTSTTTSTLCDGDDCGNAPLPLEIWLDDDVALTALDVRVTFPCSIGLFETASLPPWDQRPGTGPVRCTSDNDGVDMWATNQQLVSEPGDPEGTCRLLLSTISLTGIVGPSALMTCRFETAAGPVTADDFRVFVPDQSAEDQYGNDLPHPPAVSLRGFPDSGP